MLNLHLIICIFLGYVYASDCETVTELWKSFGKTEYIGQDRSLISFDHTDSASCCNMFGVTCQMSTVVGINWYDQSLNGSILNQIGKLSSLESLSLGVGISGDVPCSLSKLPKLRTLNLLNNANLGGSITPMANLGDINIGNTKIVNCNQAPELGICKDQPVCIVPIDTPNTQDKIGDWRLPVYISITLTALFFFGMIFIWVYRDWSGYRESKNHKREQYPPELHEQSSDVSSKAKKVSRKI